MIDNKVKKMIDNKKQYEKIDNQDIVDFMESLGIKKKNEFASFIGLNESDIGQWINKTKKLTLIHKFAWFHAIEYYKQKEQIKQLQEQLSTKDSTNDTSELKTEVQKLSKQVDELSKQVQRIYNNETLAGIITTQESKSKNSGPQPD